MPIFLESFLELGAKTWKIWAPILLAVVVIIFAYFKGYNNASEKCEASKYKAAYEATQIQLKASQKEVADLKAKKEKAHVIIEKQIERIPEVVPDNRACDLQPDALKLWNNARRLQP